MHDNFTVTTHPSIRTRFPTIKSKHGLSVAPEENIIFRRLGQTAAIRAYGRLIIQVDLATPIALAYNLRDACEYELTRNASSSFNNPLQATISTVELELDQMTNSLQALDVAKEIMDQVTQLRQEKPTWKTISSTPHHRTKRFLFAIGLAISAAVTWTATNTAMSVSNMANLDRLGKVVAANTAHSEANREILRQLLVTVKDTQTNVEELNHEILQLNNRRIKDRDQFLAYTTIAAALHEVQTLSSRLVRVCNELLQGRIETSLVDAPTLESRLEAMATKQTTGQQYQPVVTRVAEFIQLPVFSGVANGALLLFVDVPLTLAKSTMDVYRIHQVPIMTSAGYAELDSDLEYMAVSTGDRALFRALTQREFDACNSIGQEIICPKALTTWKRAPALKHADAQQCMFAAYRDDRAAMQSFCTFRMANRATNVQQISPKEVLIFLTTETSVRITCPDETIHHRFQGSILVSMQQACSVETDSFHHAADPDVVLEEAIPAPTIRVLNVLADLDAVHSELVKEAASSSMTISHALIASKNITLPEWQHYPNDTPGYLSFLATFAAFAALAILFMYSIFRCRRTQRKHHINKARVVVMNDNDRLLEEQRQADTELITRLSTGGVLVPSTTICNRPNTPTIGNIHRRAVSPPLGNGNTTLGSITTASNPIIATAFPQRSANSAIVV